MTKIELYFGVELDQHSAPIAPERAERGVAVIRDVALSLFGGCTLIRTEGEWKDPDSGRTFSEKGFMLTVVSAEHPSLETYILKVAETIKVTLNQRSIFVVRYPVQSQLY